MRRGVMWAAVGAAAVVIVAVLTAVPVTTQSNVSTRATLHAVEDPEVPDCAELEFAATFDYSVVRPLVDIWGFAAVRDLTVDDAVVSVAAGEGCIKDLERVGGEVAVLPPSCDGDPGVVMTGELNGTQPACDGKGIFYVTISERGTTHVTLEFEGEEPLAGTTLTRGGWCLDAQAGVRRDYGASSSYSPATVTEGDLCLDLS